MSDTTENLKSVSLPLFPGFYDSILTSGLDCEKEQFAEYRTTESEPEDSELHQPEHLRLSAREICEAIYFTMNYRKAHIHIAQDWASGFLVELIDATGLALKMQWEAMESPRFYNFETDRVFVKMPLDDLQKLFDYSAAKDNHATLGRVIAERHSSRDGFISFYDNTLESWLFKPLAEWDHNQFETLIQAVLLTEYSEDELWDKVAWMVEGESYYRAFDEGMDWPAYDARIAEMRAAKANSGLGMSRISTYIGNMTTAMRLNDSLASQEKFIPALEEKLGSESPIEKAKRALELLREASECVYPGASWDFGTSSLAARVIGQIETTRVIGQIETTRETVEALIDRMESEHLVESGK